MADKPSYLGMLNAIAVGEARGYELLNTWCQATSDEQLAHDLQVVAIREREHAAAFSKRICELGYSVRHSEDDKFGRALQVAAGTKSDQKKFTKLLGYGGKKERADGPDALSGLLDDVNIDPRTGALLGRFIAEERDSGQRLRAAWRRCRGDSETAASTSSGPIDQSLDQLCQRMDQLAEQLEHLKSVAKA